MRKICWIVLLMLLLTLCSCKRPIAENRNEQPSVGSTKTETNETFSEETASFEGMCVGEEAGCYVIKTDAGERVLVSKDVSSDVPVPILKSGHRVKVVYQGELTERINSPEAVYFLRDTAEDKREMLLYQSEFGCTKEFFNDDMDNSDYLASLCDDTTKMDENGNRYTKAKVITDGAQLDAFFRPHNERYYRDLYQEMMQKYSAKYDAAFFSNKALVYFAKDIVSSNEDYGVIAAYADGMIYHIIVGKSMSAEKNVGDPSNNMLMMVEIPREVLRTCNKFVVDFRFADRTRIIAKTDTEITVDSRLYPIQRSTGSTCFQDSTVFPMQDTSDWSVGDEVIIAHTGQFVKEEPWRGELLDIQLIP